MNIDYWTGKHWVDVNGKVQLCIQEHRKKNTSEFVRIRKEKARLQTDWSLPSTLCAACGADRKGRLELHHIRPLWVSALDLLLSPAGLILVHWIERPLNNRDIWEWSDAWSKIQIPSDETSFERTTLLCKRCHEREERGAYEYWSAMFLAQHPLRFGGQFDRKYSPLVPQDKY